MIRFRVHDHWKSNLVFTEKDPRDDGFHGEVEEGVGLDYDMVAVHAKPDGEKTPECVLGRTGPGKYKVFKYRGELQQARAVPVPGNVAPPYYSWLVYVKIAYGELTEDQKKLLLRMGNPENGSQFRLLIAQFPHVHAQLVKKGLADGDGNLKDDGEQLFWALTGEDAS